MTTEGPVVAVVIPAYGHPSLVIEAIESALRQEDAPPFCIVLVNDGCRLDETHRACVSYAVAKPDRVVYLRTRNGGLSAARNRGIDAVLGMWPSVRAIYFLDADNRIGPRALARLYGALQEAPEASWAFPDIEMFGSCRDYCDMSGPFSGLQLLAGNYCEAGSMVRREVFERGIRYDERMRLGYEDWEFWLQGVAAGLSGRHRPVGGLWYRKRSESMLANSQRDHEQIIGYIQRKHRDLFTLKKAKSLEERELPRFALYLADRDEVLITSDVAEPARTQRWEEFAADLRRWRAVPQRYPCPPTFVVTRGPTLELLGARGLAANVLWTLERDLAERDLAALTVDQGVAIEVRYRLSRARPARLGDDARVALCAVSLRQLDRWLQGPTSPGEVGLDAPGLGVSVRDLEIHSGDGPAEVVADAADRLRDVARRGQAVEGAEAGPPIDRRRVFCRAYPHAGDISRFVFQASPSPPLSVSGRGPHVGFALPLSEFGGVERVAHNVARELARLGWTPHLFVIGAERMRLLDEFRSTFETIHLLPEPEPPTEALVGLLGAMDVVIENHCSALTPAFGTLRRLGVKLVSQLHVVDLSPSGVPCGHPYRAVEYEHCLDRILMPSRRLYHWLRGKGVPEEKLTLVPNAPGFEVSSHRAEAALDERRGRGPSAPLRALFMARFDRQKGMDRLIELMRSADRRGSAISWKVVGKSVIAEPGQPVPDLGPIASALVPPALDAHTLTRYYRWADVLVLPSRFEGSPLSILEAQQLGCVPLATRVGAVDEQIEDGVTGYLFDSTPEAEPLASAILDRLEGLHRDRDLLLRLAEQASAARRAHSWRSSLAGLRKDLEGWAPRREVA